MIDHALLPSIHDARLPETYEQAKTLLAKCDKIDECKDWADKAAALGSYARMSKDETLWKMAQRIQARAIRRCGELLSQFEKAQGANQNIRDDDSRMLTRTDAATQAGLSEHERKTALRVAKVDATEFEAAIESDNPPSITEIAKAGITFAKKYGLPEDYLCGRTPKDYNRAMHFTGDFERHIKDLKRLDLSTLDVLTDEQRNIIRLAINEIDSIHDNIMTRI
jgi:hypothetical protein